MEQNNNNGMPNFQQPQQPNYQQPVNTVYVQQQPAKPKNTLGTAGFVLALCGLVLCWVPILNWILWILGTVFSVIGIFKTPKGLAIAGTVISGLMLIVDIVLAAWVAHLASGLLG